MATESKTATGLLDAARKMRTKDDEQAFRLALEKLGTKFQDRPESKALGLKGTRMTPSDIAASEKDISAQTTPAEAIEPFYGKAFARETAKAMLANERRPTLKPESYQRMFDEVPVYMDPDEPHGASYNVTDEEVELPNEESRLISQSNNLTLANWLLDGSEEQKAAAKEFIETNNFASASEAFGVDEKRNKEDLGKRDPEATLRHELGHHYARPMKGGAVTRKLAKLADNHMNDMSELVQAASQFQREMFKATGSRIEKPDKFIELVTKGDAPDFLSPEGKRFFVFAKKLVKEDPKALKEAAAVLPTVVKNERTPSDFLGRVSARLG